MRVDSLGQGEATSRPRLAVPVHAGRSCDGDGVTDGRAYSTAQGALRRRRGKVGYAELTFCAFCVDLIERSGGRSSKRKHIRTADPGALMSAR